MMKNPILLFMTLLFAPVALAQTTLVVQPGAPTMDGVITDGEWPAASITTQRGVTLSAMADEEFLYLAATWADATESIYRNQLTFDGNRWAKADDEDRIAFLFDMGQTGADGANCQAFCHFPGMSTNGGVVDVWNWKASRTNPMGYAEDTFWDPAGQQADEGVSTILVNDLNAQRMPAYMASSDPGAIKDFLAENAETLEAFDPFGTQTSRVVVEAVQFNTGSTFAANATLPGHVFRIPDGDIADVQAAGKYDAGTWTVEFKRKREGGDHDFAVEPGTTVSFAHEVFDNQGSDHAIDGTPIDPNVYTLDFSMITNTAIEPTSSEVPEAFSLRQNYPNPFNPSTTIVFDVPEPGFVRLDIVNLLGKRVATLLNEHIGPGQYSVDFDAKSLPSGMYYYRLSANGYSQSRRMTLVK